jgi:hypothetical protein
VSEVANNISRPGTFDDLRGFLLDHAGEHVVVEIDAPQAIDAVPVIRCEGTLHPLTLADHERILQRLDADMTASGYEGYENRDHAEELAFSVNHFVDLKLHDRNGRETASMSVHDMAVRNVVTGQAGYISEHGGQEIVATGTSPTSTSR